MGRLVLPKAPRATASTGALRPKRTPLRRVGAAFNTNRRLLRNGSPGRPGFEGRPPGARPSRRSRPNGDDLLRTNECRPLRCVRTSSARARLALALEVHVELHRVRV